MPPETHPLASAPAPRVALASRDAFLRGLIDYAGLFPPANLTLDDSVTNFAAYRHIQDSWMLGCFIVPARRLPELAGYTDLFEPVAPFPLSVLASGGDDADTFLRTLEADLHEIERFEAAHEGRARAMMLEVRVPPAVTEAGATPLFDLVSRVVELADAAAVHAQRVFFETGFSGDWRRQVQEAAAAVAGAATPALALGLKVRCGGMAPAAVPTPEQVAFFLRCARDTRLPFKATAGLHHPIRQFNRKLEVMEHGFLNVFGAGIFAHALDLSEAALRQVLRSELATAFTFDADGFGFQDLRISTAQIEAARAHFALSYGSCSFDEPRAELRGLGLL